MSGPRAVTPRTAAGQRTGPARGALVPIRPGVAVPGVTGPSGAGPGVTSPAGAADVAAHLELVDGLLTEVLTDLQHIWTTQLDGERVDVLAEDDLPQLLDRLARTRGKRLRPVMSYLGWLAAHGRTRDIGHAHAVQIGTALELLHLFALIHDDVMDESVSRRGQLTAHRQARALHERAHARGDAGRFGDSIAILLGDLAHAEADALVAELPPRMRALWRLLVVELVCGQRRDLTGSAARRHDLGHALQVARLKSGAYTVERPLELGAAAAGAHDVVTAGLTRYGRELGQAFALRDDLLGAWGEPTLTGKPAGDDLLSGKPTAIVALAHAQLSGTDRDVLALIGSSTMTARDVTQVQDVLVRAGIDEQVELMITEHVSAALAALDEQVLDATGVAALEQMAHEIAWRDH